MTVEVDNVYVAKESAMLRIASPPKKNAASSEDSGKNLAIAIPAPIKVDEIKRAVKSRYINMQIHF